MAKISKRGGKKELIGLAPEVYFLKYAFPCAFISLQRGRVDIKTYKRLEHAARRNIKLSFKELEKCFPAAFKRIRKLAGGANSAEWDIKLLRSYFWRRHNDLIEGREEDYKIAPKVLCDLCQVKKAKVMKVSDGVAVVRFADKNTRAVVTTLAGRVREGDAVMVHYGYIVELL